MQNVVTKEEGTDLSEWVYYVGREIAFILHTPEIGVSQNDFSMLC